MSIGPGDRGGRVKRGKLAAGHHRRTPERGRRGAIRGDLVSMAWRHLPQERAAIVGLAVISVIVAQAESAALVIIALIADTVARGGSTTSLELGPIDVGLPVPQAAVLGAAAIIVAAVVALAYRYYTAKISARLDRTARDQIVRSFADADWEYQATHKASRLHGRLLGLMNARAVAFTGLVGWIRALTAIAVFITIAAVMSPVVAMVILLFGAMLSLAVFPVRRRIARLTARAAKQEVELAGDVAEAADHGPDVHVFGAWPRFLDRFDDKSSKLQRIKELLGLAKGLMPMVYQYGALSLILAVLVIAFASPIEGELGEFAAAALLLLRSVQYGQQLQQSLQRLAESVPRIDLLDREVIVPSPRMVPGERRLDQIEQVELDRVSYAYPDSDGPALIDVSLQLRPGTIVGVAGPSGSGKSTLAQILLRLRWPSSGQYRINGISAEEYSETSWRQLVAHVPQQPRLLHGSLAENVAFLDQTLSRARIAAALKAVGLGELEQSLPDGLDAELGPTGRNLSGGQIQRLGIARALARGPRMVILDEPTSALDVDAEKIVGDALEALRAQPDVLVIVIAHRPSTLAMCDRMVVLQEGRVAAFGGTDDVALNSAFLGRIWATERMGPRRSVAADKP